MEGTLYYSTNDISYRIRLCFIKFQFINIMGKKINNSLMIKSNIHPSFRWKFYLLKTWKLKKIIHLLDE
jgi:hypothetical protein